jgi:hypothetical protein
MSCQLNGSETESGLRKGCLGKSDFHAAPWLRLIRSPSRFQLEAGRRPGGARRGGCAGVEQVARADG